MEGDCVVIDIADTGEGIADEILDRILILSLPPSQSGKAPDWDFRFAMES